MTEGTTIAFHTLGCKLNFAETSAIARSLEISGYSKVNFDSDADIFVINSCSVTENADKECQAIVRKALRQNSAAKIIVTGCYAQLKPEKIAAIPGVTLVLGASEKFKITEHLSRLNKSDPGSHPKIHSCEVNDIESFQNSFSTIDRTRAFLKVQDGCDYPCTYCTIPLARGKSRSGTIHEIVKQAQMLADSSIREIVLTGVNTGDFGIQNNGKSNENFFHLLEALDGSVEIPRIRISSIEPNLITEEIIEWIGRSRRVMPHFHLPLQSGSDKILGLMKRRYRSALYKSRVEFIREKIPNACIGADVLVGFPGEGENEFEETKNFVLENDINYFHVFTYSERENTEAALLPDVVPVQVRRERNSILRRISEMKKQEFYQRFASTEQEILFETENGDETISGFSKNYIRAVAKFIPGMERNLAAVRFNKNVQTHGINCMPQEVWVVDPVLNF